MRGRIARFLEAESYGFIAPSPVGANVFFHRNDLALHTLPLEGAVVSFELTDDGDARPHARRIVMLSMDWGTPDA